jgi:2-keto-4-pentenoate hydratase
MTGTPDIKELAGRLIDAEAERTGIAALTTTYGPFDVATAYDVQDAVVAADACGPHRGRRQARPDQRGQAEADAR